jgi:hypothetical protein
MSSADVQAKIANAPLRQLFWNVQDTSALLEEAEQRIAAALRKALSPETVQVFDDLYENPAC